MIGPLLLRSAHYSHVACLVCRMTCMLKDTRVAQHVATIRHFGQIVKQTSHLLTIGCIPAFGGYFVSCGKPLSPGGVLGTCSLACSVFGFMIREPESQKIAVGREKWLTTPPFRAILFSAEQEEKCREIVPGSAW